MIHKIIKTDNYLLIVDESRTIGKGYALNTSYMFLLKYDTQEHLAYDNDVIKKIIAHLPLNGAPILEGVDLLAPIEDDVEQMANDTYPQPNPYQVGLSVGADMKKEAFIVGYNKAREKYKYTEEDMRKAIDMATTSKYDSALIFFNANEIIKSISQYPTEFECEMKYFEVDMGLGEDCIEYGEIPQKITTDKGIQWVGKYK